MVDDVGKYLLEGRKLAAILGPTQEKAFLCRERRNDAMIERWICTKVKVISTHFLLFSCVQDLVREKRSKMFYMVAISAPEASTPHEPETKQLLKGNGGRRMSNSQGV